MPYRKKINELITIRNNKINEANKLDKEITKLKSQLEDSATALLIIQTVAQQTQEQLEYRISELVTLALSSVFEDPYEFKVEYVVKRDKTEANFWFMRNDTYIHPLDAAGGGAVDVAAFALRATLWSMSSKTTDNVIILDEPFKHLSSDLQQKAGHMVKEISKKLNLQFIIVSHIENLINEADQIIEVKRKKGISTAEIL